MKVRAVPAVSRAIAILRLLGRSRAPMGVKAISQALGLVPSTGLHILRVLVAEELVAVDPVTKQYSLGSGALSLARLALEGNDFPTLVQPRIDELSRRYGVTAIGVELPNLQHMIVVALSRTQAPVRLHVDVGSRFPALISATGRCVAAFTDHPKSEVERHFRALRWHNCTELRGVVQGCGNGAPPGVQHRPRQLYRRRHHRRGAGADRARADLTVAGVGRNQRPARSRENARAGA